MPWRHLHRRPLHAGRRNPPSPWRMPWTHSSPRKLCPAIPVGRAGQEGRSAEASRASANSHASCQNIIPLSVALSQHIVSRPSPRCPAPNARQPPSAGHRRLPSIRLPVNDNPFHIRSCLCRCKQVLFIRILRSLSAPYPAGNLSTCCRRISMLRRSLFTVFKLLSNP